MILWTIQTSDAWEDLQKTGVLRADPALADKDYIGAYKWMAHQMERRLDFKPPECSLPLWAWYQWHGRRRRPDLRSFTAYFPKGENGVRIEFDIDHRLVVLSDFTSWQWVLSGLYLPKTEEEADAFHAEAEKQGFYGYGYGEWPPPHPVFHKRLEESWQLIFDLDFQNEFHDQPKEERSIQAAFWELGLDWVREARVFEGRARPSEVR